MIYKGTTQRFIWLFSVDTKNIQMDIHNVNWFTERFLRTFWIFDLLMIHIPWVIRTNLDCPVWQLFVFVVQHTMEYVSQQFPQQSFDHNENNSYNRVVRPWVRGFLMNCYHTHYALADFLGFLSELIRSIFLLKFLESFIRSYHRNRSYYYYMNYIYSTHNHLKVLNYNLIEHHNHFHMSPHIRHHLHFHMTLGHHDHHDDHKMALDLIRLWLHEYFE